MSNVCADQATFNTAFREALKYNQDENMKPIRDNKYIGIVWLVFFIWAMSLALRAPAEQRVLHVLLAFVFGPVYILAYYIGMF